MTYEGHVHYPNVGTLGTWLNQASSTWTQVGNKYNLFCPVGGTTDVITGRYIAEPSKPYTAIARVVPNPTDTEGLRLVGGLGFVDGDGSTMFLNMRYDANSQTSSWSVLYCVNTTTASVNYAGYQYGPGFPWANLGWMAIRNDDTNIYFYIGDESGQNFYQVLSQAKGAALGTIAGIGIFIDHGTGTGNTDIMVESFRIIGA